MPGAAFAAQTCTISGNGDNSNNRCRIKIVRKLKIEQSNIATVTNTIGGSVSTGGNTANGNTGGDVNVGSGSATVTITITNTLNANVIVLPTPTP